MRSGSGWTAWLAACVVLAGCSGSSESRGTGSAPVPNAAATSDLGSIEGTILDEENTPLPGVSVTLLEIHNQTRSDERGGFVFNDLPPAEYRIVAEALGYESAARAVDVVAAQVTSVKVRLRALAVGDEPSVEMIPYTGMIQCSVNPGYALNPCGGLTGEDKSRFHFGVSPNRTWMEAVFELVWTPASAATGQELEFDVCDAVPNPSSPLLCDDHNYYQYEDGGSPLVIRADDLPVKKYADWLVGAGAAIGSPFPVYQQSFTIYVTNCYYAACPEGYSAIPK